MKTRMLMSLLTLILMLAAMPVIGFANDVRVTVDGQLLSFPDQGPAIVDGRTLVPVAGVFQALGFETNWDSATRQVTIFGDGNAVVVTIDSTTFTTNGVPHTLDVPAQIIGGRTMLPISAVLQSVGHNVGWDSGTRTVIITTAQMPVVDPIVEHVPTPELPYEPTEPETEAFPDTPGLEPIPETEPALTQDIRVWVPVTRNYIYHRINNCGRMNPARATSHYRFDLRARGYRACDRCW